MTQYLVLFLLGSLWESSYRSFLCWLLPWNKGIQCWRWSGFSCCRAAGQQQRNLGLCWSAKALKEFPGSDTEFWLIFILEEGSGETQSLGSLQLWKRACTDYLILPFPPCLHLSKFVCIGNSFSVTPKRWHMLEFAVMLFLASKVWAAIFSCFGRKDFYPVEHLYRTVWFRSFYLTQCGSSWKGPQLVI